MEIAVFVLVAILLLSICVLLFMRAERNHNEQWQQALETQTRMAYNFFLDFTDRLLEKKEENN